MKLAELAMDVSQRTTSRRQWRVEAGHVLMAVCAMLISGVSALGMASCHHVQSALLSLLPRDILIFPPCNLRHISSTAQTTTHAPSERYEPTRNPPVL